MSTVAEPKVLDLTQPQKTKYAVDLWLRDEQIKANIAKVSGRIQAGEKRDEPAAIVCFGPSLNDTWEQVRNFKYVFSCSGSHRFLIDRGIIPNWHVEVDPRPHKIKLLGEPHPDVEYLIASACSPLLLIHLENFNVKLWHVYDPTDSGYQMVPPSDWSIMGGCDVGLRTLSLAAFLGFRDLHVFGMDQSAGTVDKPTERHAQTHPNGGKNFEVCEYGGVTYRTTPAMAEAARTVWHELDQMPKVSVKFYGEGLVQHMARDYRPKMKSDSAGFSNIIAASKPAMISAEYRQQNTQLHRENLAYGVGGSRHAEIVKKLYKILHKDCDFLSVLDYGCGKGYLAKSLPFPIAEYDPAIPGKDGTPLPADLVVCTDVLEHIEPDYLTAVLEDLRRCVRRIGFFIIHITPAVKTLPDGRNTHLIVKEPQWWRYKLEKRFKVGSFTVRGNELWVTVEPKVKGKLYGSVKTC